MTIVTFRFNQYTHTHTHKDDRKSPPRELPLGDGRGRIGALKARAVLVDMEEGVINAALKGPLGEVFDPVLKVSSVSIANDNIECGEVVAIPTRSNTIIPADLLSRQSIEPELWMILFLDVRTISVPRSYRHGKHDAVTMYFFQWTHLFPRVLPPQGVWIWQQLGGWVLSVSGSTLRIR